jgi:drug/metabolite transporter (DMT)-like permease
MVMHALTSLPLLGIVICTSDGRKAVESLISGEKAGLLAADIALTFLAGFLILFAMTKTNPVNAAVIETSYPLFIALASFILFGSTFLNFGNLVGGLIIAIGIIIVLKWG